MVFVKLKHGDIVTASEKVHPPDASEYRYLPVPVPGLRSTFGPVPFDGVPPKSTRRSISSSTPFHPLNQPPFKLHVVVPQSAVVKQFKLLSKSSV